MGIFQSVGSFLTESDRRKRRAMYAGALASLCIVVVILLIKWVAFALTGSVTVLGALFDSFLDSLVSIINLLAVHWALSPPDYEHRFGHGKIEPVASLAQGVFIIISGCYVGYESFKRFLHPEPLEYMHVALIVASVSIILTFALILVQAYVIRITQSVIIRSDALHYKGDLLINGSIIASAVAVGAFGIVWLDAVLGMLIGLFLVLGSVRIINMSLKQLLDHELTADHQMIEDIIFLHEKVLGYHDLRTRQSSIRKFIQFHLELDANMLLKEAHLVAQEVEQKLLKVFPDAEIMIHQDPYGCDMHDKNTHHGKRRPVAGH